MYNTYRTIVRMHRRRWLRRLPSSGSRQSDRRWMRIDYLAPPSWSSSRLACLQKNNIAFTYKFNLFCSHMRDFRALVCVFARYTFTFFFFLSAIKSNSAAWDSLYPIKNNPSRNYARQNIMQFFFIIMQKSM